MRTLGLLLSLAVHCGAIGGAVVASSGSAAPRARAPRVELRATPPSPSGATTDPAAVPVRIEELAELVPPAVVPEPIMERPPVAAAADERPFDTSPAGATPWLARYRPLTARAPALSSAPPPPPPPPSSPAPAVPVFVDAVPDAGNEPPEYPAADVVLGHEGTVVVAAELDARGRVLAVELATACPFPGLNRAALRAVRGWTFAPARQRGEPVATRLEIPIVFRLTGR